MKKSVAQYSKQLFNFMALMFVVLFSTVPAAAQGDFYVIPVVSMTFRGDWDIDTSYNAKDVVFYDGSSWFSLVGPNTGNVPSAASTNWTMLAKKGDKGDQGPVNPNADMLDGLHSTAFALSSHTHSAAQLTTGSMTGSSAGNLFRVYNSGTGNGLYGESKDGVGVRAYSVTDYGIIGEGGGTAGVMARHLTSGNWVDNARSDFALKAYASASATGGGHGIEASSEKGDGLRSFASAADKSCLYGTASGTNGYGAYLASTKGQGIAVWSTSGAHDGVGSNTNGVNKSAYYGYASGSNGHGAYLISDAANGTGIYARGGTSGWAATFRGNVRIQDRATGSTVMELGKGLDYAEGFNVTTRSKIIPGSVVVIDPQHPGKLSLSSAAYDSKVAGIVAGANGLGSGVRLGAGEFDLDVALAGRVYCMVDASRGEIRPGDLLTTSTIPGYAMKARDYKRAQGAILGKAMQGLKKGEKGQILVLVTLQ